MPILSRVVAILLAIPLLIGAWTWWRSEAHMHSFTPPPRFTVAIPTDRASIARGEHIARTRGCFSCHGDKLEGGLFHEGPWGQRDVASNIALLAKRVDPAAMEASIRHAISYRRRALYSMPSYNFVNLTDADTAALIAFLRAAPANPVAQPQSRLGAATRWAIMRGEDAAIPHFLKQVPGLTWQTDPRPAVRRGEYLAMTSCNECHGFGLRGDDPFAPGEMGRAPNLAIVGGYSRPQFRHLMRTGKAVGERELRLMSGVARGRFVHWTDREVDDLYDFLTAFAAREAAR